MAVSQSVLGTVQQPADGFTHDYTGITVNSDANQVLLVAFCMSGDPGATTAVWDNGASNQSMSQISIISVGASRAAGLFGLVAPVAGLKTLRVTTTNSVGMILCGVTYKSADQTGGATTFRNAATNTGTSAAVSLAISTAAGEYTIDSMSAPTGTGTPDKTQVYFLSGSGPTDGGSSDNASAGASTTHGWTIANVEWVVCGCSIKEFVAAAAGGPGQLGRSTYVLP